MGFVHLHGYSTFSFLEAIGNPKEIVKIAKGLGQEAIALTDLNVMYGAIQLYKAAGDAEIKPIVGIDVGFVERISDTVSERGIGGMVLLAYSSQGYENLLKLTSFAGQEGISIRPKIDLETLRNNNEGVIAHIGGVDSRIARLLKSGESLQKIKEILIQIRDILGEENLYLEIIAQDHQSNPDIEQINRVILQLSEEFNIPCILSNIYMYPIPQDNKTQELAMAIKDNLKLYDENHRVLTTYNHIMSEEEIKNIALKNGYTQKQITLWCENTQKIANRCDMKIAMGQALFPKYEVDDEKHVRLYNQYKEHLIVEVAGD